MNRRSAESRGASLRSNVIQLKDSTGAELLDTSERFPRWLIAERRIEFVRAGRHVRIPESALVEFIKAGRVE